MQYAVIVINWNGGDDTVACLASFLEAEPDAVAIVVDNGSTDASVAQIAAALPVDGGHGARAVLIEARENLGFAAGCNLGLRTAQSMGLAVCVFLNNDTVVEPGALGRIVRRLVDDADCFACLPMLTVWGTDRIWNCGGSLAGPGLRRYCLAGRPRAEGAARAEIRCSFFTGCCVAVRTAAFADRGGFSERFFFGEEDFELALWMRDRGLIAVCLTSAVVQHKVSASFDRAAGQRLSAKVFVYYLNRFIHMRLRWGRWRWALWVAAYLPYTVALLLRRGVVPLAGMPAFIGALLKRSRTMNGVTRADFEVLMQGRLDP